MGLYLQVHVKYSNENWMPQRACELNQMAVVTYTLPTAFGIYVGNFYKFKLDCAAGMYNFMHVLLHVHL